ncbi:MAG: toll/interleukin-1 receptor domain-containing protein [Trueperaceae bacterium]|nr:MAG: toll/interleukin-1 receptor domain-containing protein [Trueperaceae bacterium]
MSSTGIKYDVFLSYSWRDRQAVARVARALKERGLKVLSARWYLMPGKDWRQTLKRALDLSGAVIIFLGPNHRGSWQHREENFALGHQARNPGFPVIPVLLPGSEPAPGLLSLNTWVDLREDVTDKATLNALAAVVLRRDRDLQEQVRERSKEMVASINPYKGLLPFCEEDASLFFGRTAFIEQVERSVAKSSFVTVVGASGSGKSSAVGAGLVPRLRQGRGRKVWEIATFRPSKRPLHTLAAALYPLLEPQRSEEIPERERLELIGKLARNLAMDPAQKRIGLPDIVDRILEKQPGTDRLLLVVDRWEELYTLTTSGEERKRFIDELLSTVEKAALTVVVTLRSDFYGHALRYRSLAERLQEAVVNLSPMNRAELEQAITEPAQRVGLAFQDGLVEQILNDVAEEPGNLPLLEYALTRLWEARKGNRLLHEAYRAMGGVQGMVRRADERFDGFGAAEQKALRHVLLQLIHPGETTESTRQRIPLESIETPARQAIQKLVDAQLLFTGRDEASGEETVEFAHEALIHRWQRLADWAREDHAFLLWHNRLKVALHEYQSNAYRAEFLLQGGALGEAEHWLSLRAEDLTQKERAFIQRSAARTKRQRRLTMSAAFSVAAVTLILAILATFYAQTNREQAGIAREEAEIAREEAEIAREGEVRAQRDAHIARARELASQGQVVFAEEPLLGLRLVLEGLVLAPADDEETGKFLADAMREVSSKGRLLKLGDDIDQVWSLAESGWFVLDHDSKHSEIYTFHDGRSVIRLNGEVSHFAFSPDGSLFVVDYLDHPSELRRTADPEELVLLTKPVDWITFSPDGSFLVVDYINAPGELRRTADPEDLVPLTEPIKWIAFSPDGSLLVVDYFDAPAELWRTDDPDTPVTLTDRVDRVTFSPDGSFLIVDYAGAPAELRRKDDPDTPVTLTDRVDRVTFSPDGSLFVIDYVSAPGELRHTADPHHPVPLTQAIDWITFNPNGSFFVIDYANAPGELRHTTDPHDPMSLTKPIDWIAFSPDGSLFVVDYFDAPAELRRTDDLDAPVTLTGRVDKVTFSPDGSFFVVDYFNVPGEMRRKDDPDTPLTLKDRVDKVTFSPDSSFFVTDYLDVPSELRRRDDPEAPVTLKDRVDRITFSPDGSFFVVDYLYIPSELRRSKDPKGPVSLTKPVDRITFSPDGSLLVVNYVGAPGELRHADDLDAPVMLKGEVDRVTFSSDGSLLVIESKDGKAGLWEAGKNPIKLTELDSNLAGAVFDHGVERLLIWYSDGRSYLRDTSWLRALGGDRFALSLEDLVTLACEGPLTLGIVKEEDVAPLFPGRETQACNASGDGDPER